MRGTSGKTTFAGAMARVADDEGTIQTQWRRAQSWLSNRRVGSSLLKRLCRVPGTNGL